MLLTAANTLALVVVIPLVLKFIAYTKKKCSGTLTETEALEFEKETEEHPSIHAGKYIIDVADHIIHPDHALYHSENHPPD